MAKSPSVSRDRAAAILLFCALCGVLIGIGGRALRVRLHPASPPVCVAAAPLAAPAAVSFPADGGAAKPADAGAAMAVRAAAVDAGTARSARALWVVVIDTRGQPVAGAKVAARLELSPSELAAAPTLAARPPSKSATTQPIGELGVRSGPLPFPEDVIAGTNLALGIVQRGSSDAAGLVATTDNKGVARLFPVPSGMVQILVNHDSKSAAAEVVVPALAAVAPADSDDAALRIVLRLGATPDALCMLPTEPGAPTDPTLPAAVEGSEVAGRVEDARGFAISGARLELTSGRVRTQTITDPRGGFAVRGLPEGALTVQVRHPGFAPLTLNQGADKPRHELRLKLVPGGGISGLLRDARAGGLPPGAQLFAESDGGQRQAIAVAADGRFVATGLIPGELTLHARAPGFAPLAVTVKLPAGETAEQLTLRDLRLDLEHGATLRGRVRGSDGVAAGATVTLSVTPKNGHEQQLAPLTTDSRGEFVATDLPSGKLHVKATAGSTTAHADLEITPGDTQRTELELR